MTNEQILNIFYSKIIPEAQRGKIDCYFTLNIIFNLKIENKEITFPSEEHDSGILIPTLTITDKGKFDELLIEYVKKALEFYPPENFTFLNDIDSLNMQNIQNTKQEYLIKYVISTLFANASFDDFRNPINFLESRIAMFDNKILASEGEQDLGYIESIGARIRILEEKSPIKAETPYRIKGNLIFDDGYELSLPEIYAGNTGKKYQLYGIQKALKSGDEEERVYLKQIRKGFIAKINGAPEHYFLTVMLFLSLCSDKNIEVIPFLIERWNAKKIALYNKAKRNQNISIEEIDKEQEHIQTNITDIFIRYFTKLEDVTEGMEFTSFPLELDSNLHIKINDNLQSRSMAFNELFNLANEYKKQENSLSR